MASSPREILGHLTSMPSITAAMLMKRDGSVVERAPSDGVGPETVRAVTRDLVALWESAGTDLGIGRPRALLLETMCGPLSIMPVGRDALLVAVGSSSCSIGRIRREMQRAHEATREAEHTPDHGIPDLQRILGAGLAAARRTDAPAHQAGGPSADGLDNGPAGEVVVIGVSTFRLTARLVATLTQARGVRLVRLRAYTPGRITIDVAFEEGGTLASIASACLDEYSLEVIERSDARLLLGVSTSVAPSAVMLGRVP